MKSKSQFLVHLIASCALGFFLSTGIAHADGDKDKSDPRPRLESYTRYDDFLNALSTWEERQTQQASKQTELPQQRGTLSQVDQLKLQNAFVSHPILVTPKAEKPRKIETLDSAVKAAPKVTDSDDSNLTLQDNPSIQSSDSSTLSSTVVTGALGATAAGTNGDVVRNRLQSNVENVTQLDNTLQQSPSQQTPIQNTVGSSFSYTTLVGTSSLPSSAAVNVQSRSVISGGIPH